jgi:hypothetical protein
MISRLPFAGKFVLGLFMNLIETSTVAFRFALTLDGLCRAVAARIAGGAMSAVMILLVWQRLKRTEKRVQGLLARFLAGRLRVGGVGRPGATGARIGGRSGGLPVGFGWLLKLVPFTAAGFASQMRVVLAEPEMVALLAVSPQARRTLRPLCRMLGIKALVPAPAGVTGSGLDASGEGLTSAAGPGADRCGTAGVAEPGCALVLVPGPTLFGWRRRCWGGAGMGHLVWSASQLA